MPRKAKSEGIVTELPGVAAVSRALCILSAFQQGDQKLALAEIARRVGLYKSTISRLTESLEAYGMLVRDEDGTFRLGTELIRLGAIARNSVSRHPEIHAALNQLMETTGESATYYVRRDKFRLALFRIDSPRTIRDHIKVGDLLPLDRGAAGRVLLAEGTNGSSPSAFDTIISLGERDPEVAAIAGPVYAHDRIVGALSVSGPIGRFTKTNVRKMSQAVEEKCRYLSSLLVLD
ncbi:MAG: helix-turn-helix domain-containing protein [Pseudorhodoplanes sp.]|nr:Glycerol operon regulatory protein [Pseudorhodoplanes sp.]MBW7948498.1 helix-turn-helix domain-containing protein [Pseudorhodoplanes sp.]